MEFSLGNHKAIPTILTPLIRERCNSLSDTGIPLSNLKQNYPNFEFLHFDKEE